MATGPGGPWSELILLPRENRSLCLAQSPDDKCRSTPALATARHANASGTLDMVGMKRPHGHPHIVAKITRGEEEHIRPSFGANYCLDRIHQGGAACCINDPSTGRELSMLHIHERGQFLPEHRRRRIGNDALEADVRVAVSLGQFMIGSQSAAQSHTFLLQAEGKHRGIAAVATASGQILSCSARGCPIAAGGSGKQTDDQLRDDSGKADLTAFRADEVAGQQMLVARSEDCNLRPAGMHETPVFFIGRHPQLPSLMPITRGDSIRRASMCSR